MHPTLTYSSQMNTLVLVRITPQFSRGLGMESTSVVTALVVSHPQVVTRSVILRIESTKEVPASNSSKMQAVGRLTHTPPCTWDS